MKNQVNNNKNINNVKDDYVRRDNSNEIIISELQTFFGVYNKC
jgi:hypothetical protein